MSFFDDQPRQSPDLDTRAAAAVGVVIAHGLRPMQDAVVALRQGQASPRQQLMLADFLDALIHG